MLDVRRDGFVAFLSGAADAPFADLIKALEALVDGYACRCVVMPLEGRGAAQPAAEELRALEQFAIPIAAAITGDISGGATALALSADIRVAGRGATISGLRMGTRRVLSLLGERGSVATMERGGRLDADSAHSLGLVYAVADDALAEATRLAGVIASRGPIAVRAAKEALWRGAELRLPEALRVETDLTILLQSTKDRAEGVRAFAEKRPPTFTGD